MLFRGNELARDCMNWWNPRTNCNGNFQCRCILYMRCLTFQQAHFLNSSGKRYNSFHSVLKSSHQCLIFTAEWMTI